MDVHSVSALNARGRVRATISYIPGKEIVRTNNLQCVEKGCSAVPGSTAGCTSGWDPIAARALHMHDGLG